MAKIVLIGSAYPLRGGGLATFNERLAKAFVQAGHDLTIYTFSLQYPSFLFPGKTQYSDETPPEDINIKVKINSINPFNWFKVGREIARLKPDMVIVRYWIPFMAPCLGTICRKIRKNHTTKVIAIADNIIPHEKRPGDKSLTKYFVNSVDGFITLSQSVMDDLSRFNKNKPVELCLHPLYDNFGEKIAKNKAIEALNLSPDYKYILFFGFIRDYKGLDLLIKAMAHPILAGEKIKVLVAGEFYSNSKYYLELIDNLGVKDNIILHNDFIPNEMVATWFSAADLVVQPYKDATQSGVTQVAYHFEVPMIVTNVGALPEMVPHMRAGLIVDPDKNQIAEAIHKFFNENLNDKIAITIKEEKKRFSWEKLIEKILNVYQSLKDNKKV
ncbi:MAG: glycosyltransferase family 4 protein [Bacteroidota bacterium]